MSNHRETLRNLVRKLSEESHDGSLAQYRFWLDLGTVHGHVPQDQVDNDVWKILQPGSLGDDSTVLIHPNAHLFFSFIGDMEDKMVSRCASEYYKHHCARILAESFELNLGLVGPDGGRLTGWFLTPSTSSHAGPILDL